MYDAGYQLGSRLSAVGISSTACGAVSVLPAVRLVTACQIAHNLLTDTVAP